MRLRYGVKTAAMSLRVSFKRLFQALTCVVAATVLAACGLVEGDGRHLQPLPSSVEGQLRTMGSSPGEAMLVRIYKEESALEVWKKVNGGTYKFFKTYEICNYSGELGPKIREGDRQSPEGFYSITPGLMNPKSNYYLAFNTGFPNKFDRAYGRTGSNLMVHGDCSSRGCYAMTDEQIAEIYALGREAFKGGQRTFELQIFPFRMTAENLAKHHDSPHIDFWRNLKEGYDAFEISGQPAAWDVCEKRYVFNPAGGATDANGACPAQSTTPELMAKVKSKQISDQSIYEIKVAEYKKRAADKLLADEKEAERLVAAKAREEAVKEAISKNNEAVGGFFDNVFGGFFGDDSDAEKTTTPNTVTAPVPVDPVSRS